MNVTKNNKGVLYAVYGSLRKGFHNHNYYLANEDCSFLGHCLTEPIYNMHSLGSFPGVKQNGNNSIMLELYYINNKRREEQVDLLEGICEDEPELGMYKKEIIETPLGNAYLYVYNDEIRDCDEVISGDWYEYNNND